VIELGVLDDIAMGSKIPSTRRSQVLRDTVTRISGLLTPNGAWLEVSSVPPELRVPLLQKLDEPHFRSLDPKHDVQQIVRQRSPKEDNHMVFEDRDTFVADMLLHGDTGLHVYSYVQHLKESGRPAATITAAPSYGARFLNSIEELLSFEELIKSQRPFSKGNEL